MARIPLRRQRSHQSALTSPSTTAGFTLLEMIVVVVIVGIIAAIAAPSWLGLMSQQRLGRTNDQVLQAIRRAQAEAKRTGTYREARFDVTSDPPRYAVVPVTAAYNTTLTLTPLPAAQVPWETFGEGNIRANTIRLTDNNANGDSIIFSPKGEVVRTTLASTNPAQLPFIVTVSLRNNNSGARRCTRVETLLGATSQGSNANCPTVP